MGEVTIPSLATESFAANELSTVNKINSGFIKKYLSGEFQFAVAKLTVPL